MILAFSSLLMLSLFFFTTRKRKQPQNRNTLVPSLDFPKAWRPILVQNVTFYNALNTQQKELFEFKTQEFLLNCEIIGVDTIVEEIDKVLIAASAVIPIFNFPNWHYPNLSEIILYPNSFNHDFQRTGPDRAILGMVGNGYLEGKMILSRQALRLGFQNESDKKNTAIHEFVHLIDKLDGNIDGIPEVLLEKQYTIPWIDLMNKKMDEIYQDSSDINPYGGTNRAEFFSVVSEYFFERPKLLAKKHPKLYDLLEQIFKQDMDDKNLHFTKVDISRNDPCYCNSGRKYKKCCAIN